MKKERTVFEGLAPDAVVCPELIAALESTMAQIDDDISRLMASRAAYVRLIRDARVRMMMKPVL